MPYLLFCPLGHRWSSPFLPSAGPSQCPECGQAAQGVAPDLPSFHPLEQVTPVDSPINLPPTIAANPFIERQRKSKPPGDHTVTPEFHGGDFAVGATAEAGYEILEELGRGGMGVVYKARQRNLNRLVALKMILSGPHAGEAERARFRAEAEMLAPLRHPHIVQVYEVGELDGHPYLSLELVEGGSLAHHLAGNPQSATRAARLIEVVARAVHFAHQHGVVHRDLKPANVLLQLAPGSKTDAANEPEYVAKVTDFGLAKRLEAETSNTRTGAALGTPSYIAPEQAAGKKDVGPPADIYSLGAVLYEMLTGRPPFKGETAMDTMLQVMTEEPVPPRRLQPKVPPDLDTICLKCIAKEPARRYASAEALADDLQRFVKGEPIHARPAGPIERGIKWARRRPTAAALVAVSVAAVVALVFAGFAYTVLLQKTTADAQQRAKDLAAEKATAELERAKAQDAEGRAVGALKTAEQQRAFALQQVDLSNRSRFALELIQAANVARSQPTAALELLDDPGRCPANLRDFTWSHFHRVADRHRGSLTGAKGPAPCLAISPTGDLLANAGQDGFVYLFSPVEKDTPPRTFPHRHTGPVVAMAFAPDGRTLATASFDKTIKLFDCRTDPVKELTTLEGHQEGVRALAFSADGKLLASGSHDRAVRLWDIMERKEKSVLNGHKAAVNAVAFSPDDKLLASAGADGAVRFWDASEGKEATDWTAAHGSPVLSLTWVPGQPGPLSGALDGSIAAWDLAGKKRRSTFIGHRKAVQALGFVPERGLVVSGSADGTVRLWQPITGEEKVRLLRPSSTVPVTALAGGRLLAAAGLDQHIDLWDVGPEPAPLTVDLGKEGTRTPITALDRSGRILVVVARREQVVRVIDTESRQERPLIQGWTVNIESAALAPDGALLALGGEDGAVRIYETSNGRLRATFPGHSQAVRNLAFSGDGTILLSGSMDGSLKLWDVANGKEKSARLPALLPGGIRSLAIDETGTGIAYAGNDKTVYVWNTETSKDAGALAVPSVPRSLTFTPDGRSLAVHGQDGGVQVWDMDQRTVRLALPQVKGATTLAFSPDRKVLATGHDDWVVRLWDAATGQQRGTLMPEGPASPIHALTFSHNGRWLLSVAENGMVRWW
jgi:WD40 repeat protein/tRNA A-37 threonylcarbamoyl transferase component Bud32